MKAIVRSINGQTKMLPRAIGVLSHQMLSEVTRGVKISQGILGFPDYDVIVTLRRVPKRGLRRFFFRLIHRWI